jgi:alkanesulfonate monooxygenase SsuD/methylene tetrahydromethanopterin reductase-like flavin-dependent oxidoreductase (luciferase family)
MGYRNPALLAKMTSTLDQISDGRLIVGVGAGWFRDEFLAYNYAFPSNAERIDQLAEGIKVLKAMWTQDEPTFHGRHFSIDKAYNFPKPIQKPHPPLMIGGSGKLMMPLSAREADIANFVPPVTAGMLVADQWSNFDRSKMKTRITMLRELAQKAGRGPDQIEISALCFCFISASASEARALYRQALKGMGIDAPPDPETMAPKVLVGTPQEISHQVRSIAEDLGITYFGPIFGPSVDALELFGRKVLPEFSTL